MQGNSDDPIDATLELEPFELHHGGRLENPKLSLRLEGNALGPVVAVLGGISAHRTVAGARGVGWWPEIVGAGSGIDTRRYRVLGIDYLGGRGGSTAPAAGSRLPPISSYDQAHLLAAACRQLKLPSLHAIVGASYGGMVALCFAERHAPLVQRIVVVSAAAAAHPMSTAWRSVQRQIVREALGRGEGAAGLKLARALAMITYRSPAEFAQRFGGEPRRTPEAFRFPVEDYLFARGEEYTQHYRAESFLALSESLDLHRVDAARITARATLIGVRQDQLVPFADMQSLAARLNGTPHLIAIDSIFGHDAFLKESAVFAPLIEQALAEQNS